jgi:hypothetical protein
LPTVRACDWPVRVAVSLWVGILAALAGGPAAGQSVSARECCLSLLAPIGARALSLGSAINARPAPDGLFANPALLAEVDEDEFLVHNANSALDKSNTFSLVVHTRGVGTFALSYRLVDFGEQEARDPSGNPTGTLGILDHVLSATFATAVVGGVNAGVTYKLFQFRQDCRGFCGEASFAATTHFLDAGVHVRPPIRGLELGASLIHTGFALQVINQQQASPTPSRLRVGAAYEVLRHFQADTTTALWLSADVISPVRGGGAPLVGVGAEVTLQRTIFLRAGYAGGTGFTAGAAVGVGLRFDRFDLGVGKSFASSPLLESDPVQVTFGVRF